MVEDKIKALQGTKTIIHVDSIDHHDLIISCTTLKNRNDLKAECNGTFCISLDDAGFNTWCQLSYFKNTGLYDNYKIITSTELISSQIYEVW